MKPVFVSSFLFFLAITASPVIKRMPSSYDLNEYQPNVQSSSVLEARGAEDDCDDGDNLDDAPICGDCKAKDGVCQEGEYKNKKCATLVPDPVVLTWDKDMVDGMNKVIEEASSAK